MTRFFFTIPPNIFFERVLVKMFKVDLNERNHFVAAVYVARVAQHDHRFILRKNARETEYVTCVRTVANTEGRITSCQLQTNFGRHEWFGEPVSKVVNVQRVMTEDFAEDSQAILQVRIKGEGQELEVMCGRISKSDSRRQSIKSLLYKAKQVLSQETESIPSVWHQLNRGKLVRKLPINISALFFSYRPSLTRLMLQENEPCSIFDTLTKRGSSFDRSLLDILVMNEPKDSLAALATQYSLILKCSIAKSVTRRSNGRPSIARLTLSPSNSNKGFRSVHQLLVDDENFDDVERPSLLRMLLFGEDKKDCALRAMLVRNPSCGNSSLFELALKGDQTSEGSLIRAALSPDPDCRLARLMTDSPWGKASIAKYLFAGGRTSVLRLLLLGEMDASQESLLRLLISNKTCLMILMNTRHEGEETSVFEQMTSDNEHGLNLARSVLAVTYRIMNGRLETISNEDLPPSLIQNGFIFGEMGTTLAHFALSGEEHNGFSMLRALLCGESSTTTTSHMKSILRLLCEPPQDGKPKLISILMKEAKNLILQKKSFQLRALLPLALKMQNRIRELGHSFARDWSMAWSYVSKQIEMSSNKATATDMWKKLGPMYAKMCGAIANKRWAEAFFKFTSIAAILDKEHGNRFMISQGLLAQAAKSGVRAGFGISKGVTSAVSKKLPSAAGVLNGVHGILNVAEGITQSSIDAVNKVGENVRSGHLRKLDDTNPIEETEEFNDFFVNEEDEEGEEDYVSF